MESVLIALGGVLAVGSLSGLSAAVRVASLERRIALLERSAAIIAAIAAWLAFVAYRDGATASLVVLNFRCGATVLVLGASAALGTTTGRWSSVAGRAALVGLVVLVGVELHGQTALVTTKIMVVDLAGASSLLRVVSLVVLGVILIGASYAYHRLTARDS